MAPSIGEQIKWNNPCFYFTGEMPAFDPKEYKREIVVMNLFKGRIMLVLPSGGPSWAHVHFRWNQPFGRYTQWRSTSHCHAINSVKMKQSTETPQFSLLGRTRATTCIPNEASATQVERMYRK